MIKLRVAPQTTPIGGTTFTELDTLGTENINIEYQIDDIRDLSKKQGSYSKNFKLPATKTNNIFFGKYYDIDIGTNDFNEHFLVRCVLEIDGITILEGFLKLLDSVKTEDEAFYNIVVFNEVVSLKEAIGDLTICDLDLSDIDHAFSESNVINSGTATGVSLTAGGTSTDVLYALTNSGEVISNGFGFITHNSIQHQILHLRLEYILGKIFDLAGIKVESEFFATDDFKNIYFDCGSDAEVGNNYGYSEITASVSPVSVFSNTLAQQAYAGTNFINFTQETDPQGLFGGTAFTAPVDMTVNFVFNLSFRNTNSFPASVAFGGFSTDFLLPGNVNFGYQSITNFGIMSTPNACDFETETIEFSLDMPAGASVDFWCSCFVGGVTSVNGIVACNVLNAGFMNTVKITPLIANETNSSICARIGDYKLADIVSDTFKMFNLSTIQLSQNRIRIEDYSNFLTFGTNKDWTKKLDNRQIKVKPIEIPQTMIFSHAKDNKDLIHTTYEDHNLSVYGEQKVSFAIEKGTEIKVENKLFAAANMFWTGENNSQNGQPISIGAIMKGSLTDGLSPFKNKPRLVYKNNNPYLEANTNVHIQDLANQFTTNDYADTLNTAIPYSNRSDSITDDSNLLLYSTPNPSQVLNMVYGESETTNQTSSNTLFNKYWFAFLREKYNENVGKLFIARFNLTPADIQDFNFADTIRVDNQEYRVNKISYNTDTNELAKVELLKL